MNFIGKENTDDMLPLRRPDKSLSFHWCILCMGSGESIDYLFLHCPLTLRLWHKLFSLAKMDWALPRSIGDMMTISFRGLGTSIIGKNLWQIAALTVLWIMWQVRNVGIFEEKWRMERMSWNILNVYSSLWASCTVAFRGVSLNVI